MTFTEKARQAAAASWQGSFSHPFITELQAGTLDQNIFRYYLIQDHYYLKHFNRLYTLTAEQTSHPELKAMLYRNAEHLALGELAIRKDFFEELEITENELAVVPVAPTAYHYVSHLYRQLLEGTPNAAAASLLPCSWLYQELGTSLLSKQSPVPIYQRWIESYAGADTLENVQQERAVIDQLYTESTPEVQEKMMEAFIISSEMEYAFWEMSYQRETWKKDTAVTESQTAGHSKV